MPEIAAMGDIHVGHPAAVWPDSYVTKRDIIIKASPTQQVMLGYWNDFWKNHAKNADYVINLAESIEGYNRKENARDLVTANLDEQCGAFVQLIKPYIKGRKYLSVSGSQYHGSRDMDVEAYIAGILGGQFLGTIANLELKGTGKLIQVSHKAGSAMLYKVTMLARKSLYMSAIKNKLKFDPDLMMWAHDHQYFMMGTPTRTLVMLPSWKFWHPIKDASKYEYTQPTIGGVIIKIPKKGAIQVEPWTYPLEHIYDAVREV